MNQHNSGKIIEELAIDDEEKGNRIRTIKETYEKQDLEHISGFSVLSGLVTKQYNEEDVITKLKMIREVLEEAHLIEKQFVGHKKENYEKNFNDDNKDNNSATNSEKLIQTVENNIKLLFTDQYDTAYSQVQINNHTDT